MLAAGVLAIGLGLGLVAFLATRLQANHPGGGPAVRAADLLPFLEVVLAMGLGLIR